jgi:hypothetical protein
MLAVQSDEGIRRLKNLKEFALQESPVLVVNRCLSDETNPLILQDIVLHEAGDCARKQFGDFIQKPLVPGTASGILTICLGDEIRLDQKLGDWLA